MKWRLSPAFYDLFWNCVTNYYLNYYYDLQKRGWSYSFIKCEKLCNLIARNFRNTVFHCMSELWFYFLYIFRFVFFPLYFFLAHEMRTHLVPSFVSSLFSSRRARWLCLYVLFLVHVTFSFLTFQRACFPIVARDDENEQFLLLDTCYSLPLCTLLLSASASPIVYPQHYL